MINPYKNREQSSLAIKTAEKISRWVATITTGIGGGIWGYSIALKYLPSGWEYSGWIATVIGVTFAAILGWLTDQAFGDLLQRVVTDLVAAKHPNAVAWNGPDYFKKLRRVETIMFCIVLLGLFVFDGYTTIIIRDPIADEAKKVQIVDIAAYTASLSEKQRAATAPLLAQVNQLKADIAAADRKAANANPSLTKLSNEGNAWAKGVISKNRDKATRAIKAELDKANAAYTAALGGQSAALNETQRIINQQNLDAETANARNRDVMAGMYTVMTVCPKLLSIILRILMVITFFAYSSSLELDLNGDGIIDYSDVNEHYAQLVRRRNEQEERARATRARSADFEDISGPFK